MAIDVYREDRLVLSLDHATFQRLDPALDALRRKAGVTVDAYATTFLQPAHAALLAKLARELGAGRELEVLLTILDRAAADQKPLRFEGD